MYDRATSFPIPIFTGDHFSWDKETKTLSGCASTGQLYELFRPGVRPPLYLRLQSEWTQDILDVFLVKENRNGDSEIESWIYSPENCRFTVEVFND